MTQGEVIKYGLDLCKQEIGIDGSIFIPKLVSTAYINAKIDFESRTCNSCKWGIYVYNKDILLCGAAVCLGLDEYGQYVVTKDFGCNKWEQTNKEN